MHNSAVFTIFFCIFAADNTSMQKLNQHIIRVYAIVLLWMFRLRLWAQDDELQELTSRSRNSDDEFLQMEEMMENQSFHIRFFDILMVVFLIGCCYVFGKIWKGCTYMILFLVVFYFFFMR